MSSDLVASPANCGRPFGQLALSLDLYVEGIAGHEPALVASLNDDADDALLCVLVTTSAPPCC
jgi:hypothetical protein